MQFAQRLNKLKQDKRLTNVKIAEYADASESAVRNWLNGHQIPNVLAIASLCEKLNISADFLLGLENTKNYDQQELLSLWNKLDPIKQAEFKGELKGYVKAKEEKNK